MGDAVDRLGPLLLDGAVAVIALLGVTALAMVACGQPARRCLMARVALLGVLVVIPLAVYAPVPRFPLRRPLDFLAPPAAVRLAGTGNFPTFEMSRRWRQGLVAATLTCTAVGLGSILLGWCGCGRLLRKTIEPAPETQALYESIEFHSLLPRPRLRVSARVRHPALIGTFRPTIVIPPDLDEPDQTGPLRLSLLHELAHAERLDPWFGLVAAVAGSFWFFLPPLWWIRHQMRLDQEFLADRRASRHFGPPLSYASSLLGLAESGPGGGKPGPTSSTNDSSEGSSLFRRVLMLIRCPFPVETHAPRWWRWVCIPVLACGTVLASGLTLQETPGQAPLAGSCDRARPDHGLLQIGKLAIEARRPGPDGVVLPYSLPRKLPDRFEMILDVWANPNDLPAIAIAGRRLGPVPSGPDDPPLVDGYHKVRLVRDAHGLFVWVAGRPVPPQPRDIPPPDLLSVQPAPGKVGRYRNLILTW